MLTHDVQSNWQKRCPFGVDVSARKSLYHARTDSCWPCLDESGSVSERVQTTDDVIVIGKIRITQKGFS